MGPGQEENKEESMKLMTMRRVMMIRMARRKMAVRRTGIGLVHSLHPSQGLTMIAKFASILKVIPRN